LNRAKRCSAVHQSDQLTLRELAIRNVSAPGSAPEWTAHIKRANIASVALKTATDRQAASRFHTKIKSNLK
jgi:hypothetical protein